MAKKTAAKAATKSEIFGNIADETGLTKKEVAGVFESLNTVIKKQLGRRGPGVFTVPGLMKLSVQRKPATKARPGVNPFTGEEIMIKAKPARNVVKMLAVAVLVLRRRSPEPRIQVCLRANTGG